MLETRIIYISQAHSHTILNLWDYDSDIMVNNIQDTS